MKGNQNIKVISQRCTLIAMTFNIYRKSDQRIQKYNRFWNKSLLCLNSIADNNALLGNNQKELEIALMKQNFSRESQIENKLQQDKSISRYEK